MTTSSTTPTMSLPRPRVPSSLPILLILLTISTVSADGIMQIYSVHTTATPYCPRFYAPDASYIGCCPTGSDYGIVYGKGPDGNLSPGCCWMPRQSTCTGAPPIMYDWTLDADGNVRKIDPNVITTASTTAAGAGSGTATRTTTNPTATAKETGSSSDSSSSSSSSTSSSVPGSPSSSSGLGQPAIIGIVVSVICSLISLAAGIWYKKKRHDLHKQKQREGLGSTDDLRPGMNNTYGMGMVGYATPGSNGYPVAGGYPVRVS